MLKVVRTDKSNGQESRDTIERAAEQWEKNYKTPFDEVLAGGVPLEFQTPFAYYLITEDNS